MALHQLRSGDLDGGGYARATRDSNGWAKTKARLVLLGNATVDQTDEGTCTALLDAGECASLEGSELCSCCQAHPAACQVDVFGSRPPYHIPLGDDIDFFVTDIASGNNGISIVDVDEGSLTWRQPFMRRGDDGAQHVSFGVVVSSFESPKKRFCHVSILATPDVTSRLHEDLCPQLLLGFVDCGRLSDLVGQLLAARPLYNGISIVDVDEGSLTWGQPFMRRGDNGAQHVSFGVVVSSFESPKKRFCHVSILATPDVTSRLHEDLCPQLLLGFVDCGRLSDLVGQLLAARPL